MSGKKEHTRIKICGLSRTCDIEYVNEAKPDFCGFIIHVPKSIRNVSLEQVKELEKNLDSGIIPVGVFVNEPIENIIYGIREGLFTHVQLHGKEDDLYIRELKAGADRDITVIKAFSVMDEASVKRAQESSADHILLDNGSGGTGQSFDWALLRDVERPYFLAGGLNPDNLPEAVERLRPWAVDVSSGVETDGRKDREKVLAAVRTVR